jgi:hypothetical protein
MDGRLDLTSFNITSAKQDSSFSNFTLHARLYVHHSPLTGLRLSLNSDYLLITTQDCMLKLVRVNTSAIGEKNASFVTTTNDDENSNVLFIISEFNTSDILKSSACPSSLCSITAVSLYEDNTRNELTGASGHQGGQACVWNFLSGECVFRLQQTAAAAHNTRPLIKLEMTEELLVTLSVDHQLCIWNRHKGRLVKELRFIAPLFKRPLMLRGQNRNNETNFRSSFGDDETASGSLVETYNFNLVTATFFLASSLFKFVTRRRGATSGEARRQAGGERLVTTSETNDTVHNISPTMCLYSKNIVAMGGCACIFFWNLSTGELVKKVNISKERQQAASYYSEASYIKELRLVRQRPDVTAVNNAKGNKLLIASDYNDVIYVLKIPTNFF